jgi:hypothetical protein
MAGTYSYRGHSETNRLMNNYISFRQTLMASCHFFAVIGTSSPALAAKIRNLYVY